MQITVRKATAADAEALARLRWRWRSDEHSDTGMDEATFLDSFTAWAVAHMATHVPFLAEVDRQVVGMAWLMVADRVPGLSATPADG